MDNLTGFESSILSEWSGWDGNQEMMIFYDAKTKIDVDQFKAGTVFDTVIFLMEKSIVQFVSGNLYIDKKFRIELE